MLVVPCSHLDREKWLQYKALLKESDNEDFFYGVPLDHYVKRQIILVRDEVVGFFEDGKVEFEGRSYYRTNRPYTGRKFRGNGYMLEALKFWYADRLPAMCWIDDENLSSIRLFQNLGFRQYKTLFHKNKNGSVYAMFP